MLSELIKEALEREVVGQPHAIHSVVRGMTRLLAGVTPRERTWCAYLFIGPPGTGRAHLVRTVARVLHGDEQAVLTVNCDSVAHADPWSSFLYQLSPLFAMPDGEALPFGGRPPRILLVQDLEHAQKEFYPLLARMLETGQVALPGGRRGRLENCLIFVTSGLCTREILEETSRIGFPGATSQDGDEDGHESVVELCRTEAENQFGVDLLSQFDSFVVFRRLEEEHLTSVLEGHFARMNRWLSLHRFQCELLPRAREYLLERGSRRTMLGARDLILAHRREVEFPVADLMVSGEIPPGGRVVIDHQDDEHLHFTIVAPDGTPEPGDTVGSAPGGAGAREVAVAWGETQA